MRILIVEDEVKTADYLCKGLSESGFLVEVALNGLDGQHLVQESECSGQLNPDTWLGRSSAFAGAIPSLC